MDGEKYDLDSLFPSREQVNLNNNNINIENRNKSSKEKRKYGPRCRNSRKRTDKSEGSNKIPTPIKEAPVPRPVQIKNAVMMLNEMFPPPNAPVYKVLSQTGPPNNPTFHMVCCISDQSFTGEGRSKRDAKLACSQLALKTLCPFLSSSSESFPDGQKPRTLTEIDEWMELEGKNPVSILNELYPGTQFQLVSSNGPSHAPEFIVRAILGNISFDGVGKSKKDAKLHASKALLVCLHKVGFNPVTGELISSSAQLTQDIDHAVGHTWADKIGKLMNMKFNEVFFQTTYSKRKVLAGIVMTRDQQSEVVCMSTGTKCINGENLSLAGTSLNDSHAEIIARRGLLFWLYVQLIKATKDPEGSVFTVSKDGGFILKKGVFFDLFISTAPCGDSRIFSLHEEVTGETNLLSGPTGICGDAGRGKLRSKVESGMGTVPLPVDQNLVQTWDGVTAGERLLTMSCSDKILRWNILGCQGSLLSHWIQPLYFTNIIIGSRFHPGHMSRAFYDRFEGNCELPDGFRVQKPQILATTSPESRQVWKSSDCSVNWVLDHGPEIINGSTGRTQAGLQSRLCKSSLSKRFAELVDINVQTRSKINKENLQYMKYAQLKSLAVDYQTAKEKMVSCLKTGNAGKWIKKPVEQDQFYI